MGAKPVVVIRDLFRAWENWVCCAALMTAATDGLAINPPYLSGMPAVDTLLGINNRSSYLTVRLVLSPNAAQ